LRQNIKADSYYIIHTYGTINAHGKVDFVKVRVNFLDLNP